MKRARTISICILCILSLLLGTISCAVSNGGSSYGQPVTGEVPSSDPSVTRTVPFDEEDDVEAVIDEDYDGKGPSITVFTEFPTGTITEAWIDVTYKAIPGEDADITEVYYTINDGFPGYIYLNEPGATTNRGELGKGRVMFAANEENRVVFFVKDSMNRTARFVIENKPFYDFKSVWDDPGYDDDKFVPSEKWPGSTYLMNRIEVVPKDNVTREEVEEAVKEINGVIIGSIPSTYFIEVPDSTEQELEEMCALLREKYGELFELVYYLEGGGKVILAN